MRFSNISKTVTYLYCLFFLLFVAKFAVNLPYQDDANLLETTIPGLGFKDLILNLFSADSDHIQVYPKLTTLLQYKLLGFVNFKQLSIYITFLVIVTISFLIRFSKKTFHSVYFIPVFLLILQPQIFEISFWVLPGLQHAYAMLFMVLAIYFFDLSKKYNLISLFLAASSTFCTGNGLLAFFGIMYILILYRKPIWYTLTAFIISLCIYLLSYKPSAAVREKVDILNILDFQTMFWTSPFEVFNRQHFHFWGGIIIIISILFLFTIISKNIFSSHKIAMLPLAKLFAILIFCGGTALLISFSREYDVIFSRFQFYALIGLSVTYLIVIEVLDNPFRKYFALFFGSISFFICLFSFYINLVKIENTDNKYLADTFNWKSNKTMMMVDQPYLELADKIYSKTDGITFLVDDDLISKKSLKYLIEKQIQKWPYEKLNLNITKDEYPRRYFYDEHFLLTCENFKQKNNLASNWFIIFSNNSRNYILAPQYNPKFKAAFIKSQKYYENGFLSYIPTLNFSPDLYHIYLLNKENNSMKVFDTNWQISFMSKIPTILYK